MLNAMMSLTMCPYVTVKYVLFVTTQGHLIRDSSDGKLVFAGQ